MDFYSPIDPNSLRYFLSIASWEGILAWLLIFCSFVLFMIYKHKNKKQNKKLFTFSFLIGLLMGLIFFIIYNLDPPQANPFPNLDNFVWITWQNEVTSIFTIFTSIYFSLLIIIIPLLIFVSLIVVINRNRHKSKIGTKVFITSFFSLWLMAFIGIVIAILIKPLIDKIYLEPLINTDIEPIDPTTVTITSIISSLVPRSISVFGSLNLILAIVFLGIFLGFILKTLHQKFHTHGERVISFFENILEIIKIYIKIISYLLPFVIMTRIPLIFIGDFLGSIINLALFIFVFLIGWFIINVIESSIIFLSVEQNKFKKPFTKTFFKNMNSYWIEALTKVNSSSLLPYTIETSLKFKLDSEISHFTPSLATTMGQSICAAFYPTFIALMSANLYGADINLSFILILFIIVMITNIGVTGIPGADSTLNIIVLGTMGLPVSYYANIMLIEPILDSIRTVGNATGFLAATSLTSKISKKFDF